MKIRLYKFLPHQVEMRSWFFSANWQHVRLFGWTLALVDHQIELAAKDAEVLNLRGIFRLFGWTLALNKVKTN